MCPDAMLSNQAILTWNVKMQRKGKPKEREKKKLCRRPETLGYLILLYIMKRSKEEEENRDINILLVSPTNPQTSL